MADFWTSMIAATTARASVTDLEDTSENDLISITQALCYQFGW